MLRSDSDISHHVLFRDVCLYLTVRNDQYQITNKKFPILGRQAHLFSLGVTVRLL